ncbi:MAG: hypothetical protein M1814_000137 [Vezdaea aestivalis]|nr:MAG: hypothetical protein M1814_000137 [Vezdaea aestivalis]
MGSKSIDALAHLDDLKESRPLSILQLGEPFAISSNSNATRNSDISNDALDQQTPEVLENDLIHYKELFSKLRFSYLEQVTKEKFLRAIVGDPPLIVEHQENVELEAQIAEIKASLKAQKAEVADFVDQLERSGRALVNRYETIQAQTTQLRELPESITNLQEAIATLHQAHTTQINPSLRLPLPATQTLLEKRKLELAQVNQHLLGLQSKLPKKSRELDRLQAELKPLEAQRLGSSSAAREAQRRKKEGLGGVGDDLENRARWWRSVDAGLKEMLDLEDKAQL